MRCLLLCMLLPLGMNAQIIIPFAGGGVTLGDGGSATTALISDPGPLSFDNYGNLYFPEGIGDRVRKIDTVGIITTIAGTGINGNSGDSGLATAAKLHFPDGLALDAHGNIFIADCLNHKIRRVDATTGIITTICGNGTSGYSGDSGLATAAQLYGPNGICFDHIGNLFIADLNNNVIRKVDTNGIITTFAGTGVYGYNGDGIPATSAKLYQPGDMQVDDSDNVYIADGGNARIRKVDKTGIISTFAGNGVSTYIGDGMPATSAQFSPSACLKFDSEQNLYFSDEPNNRVYVIYKATGIFHTVAGNGNSFNAGDGGPAISASFAGFPFGIAFDKCDNMYIGNVAASGDSDRIRKVLFNPACWPTGLPNIVTNELVIYPNPATSEININNITEGTNYALLNISGIIEQQGILKKGNNTISIQYLPPGIYLLELTDNEGQKTIKKIVKE